VLHQKAISLFFLSLLLLVSGHNALIHDHHGSAITKDLSSTHHHPGDYHHHHGGSDFWDWLQGLVGDFEHPDLGEQHLEVYLQPTNSVQLHPEDLLNVVRITGSIPESLRGFNGTIQGGVIPAREPTGNDPPCLTALTDRGPPRIS
jgi:hypothetical protein